MTSWIAVFLGGGLGACCRYGLGRWLGTGTAFPWATLLANGLSCIAFGAALAWAARRGLAAEARLFLLTGFCGGFSTFSTFAHESQQLLAASHWLLLGANIGGSLLLCLGCLWLGSRLF